MHFSRRALLVATPALALAACGTPGTSQAAQDARLIVAAITPVAQTAARFGATPAMVGLIDQSLATARAESATLSAQYAPSLLDTQAFFLAARNLLQALGGVAGLPPASMTLVDAAVALLPTFTVILGTDLGAPPPKMAPEQARLVLHGAAPPPAAPAAVLSPPPAPAAVPPPPVVAALPPAGGRFHVSADDIGGKVSYEFSDNGQVMERGVVANFSVLEARFAAFRRQRLQQAP